MCQLYLSVCLFMSVCRATCDDLRCLCKHCVHCCHASLGEGPSYDCFISHNWGKDLLEASSHIEWLRGPHWAIMSSIDPLCRKDSQGRDNHKRVMQIASCSEVLYSFFVQFVFSAQFVCFFWMSMILGMLLYCATQAGVLEGHGIQLFLPDREAEFSNVFCASSGVFDAFVRFSWFWTQRFEQAHRYNSTDEVESDETCDGLL